MKGIIKHSLSLLFCLFALIPILSGQTLGVIDGYVRDPSEAVVVGAEVTARDTRQGAVRSTVTDNSGRFVFADLPAGEYEIRVRQPGFRPIVRSNLILTVAERQTLDLTMEVGAIDQEITVRGNAATVNTQTSELSYLVAAETIERLPLNGRNYTDLALLQPTVTAFPNRDGGSVVAHGMAMSVNGRDPRSNVYLLDGTVMNDFTNSPAGSAASTTLGMETIQEFRVEVNNYSAEFGRNSGGQFNVITKSGSNRLRGTLYEYLRNDNLDARNFFDPADQPEFRRNQFGASLGGPIRRDKAFFFVGYEGLREALGRTISTVVPDEASRQGVLPDPQDPSRTIQVNINPQVQPYLSEFPLPNGPNLGGGLAAYAFGFNQNLEEDFFQGRYDRNLTATDRLFLRYTIDDADQRLPTEFPQFPRSFVSQNHFATIQLQQVLSPRTLQTFRGSFSRTQIGQQVESNTATPLASFVPTRNLPGNIDIGGIPRWGPQISAGVQLVQNLYGFEYGLSLTRGRHVLKMGTLAERYQDNMVNPTFSLGIFAFSDLREFLENRPLRFVGLGPTGAIDRYWRFTLFGLYLQDDIRIHPRFTLNLGIRWEPTTMPKDIYGRDSALLNLDDPAPVTGQLYRNPSRSNVSPRGGFAWDIFGNGRTSLRGGYGIFYNVNNQQHLIVTVTNPPATPRLVIGRPTFPVPPFDRAGTTSIRPIEWNIKNPYVQMWNANIQQSLGWQTILTLGYAGSRGVHLWRSTDINVPAPVRQSDGTYVYPAGVSRPNPNFSTIEIKTSDGNSWYNAGIVELRKRFGQGVSFQSSYTLARNIDTTQASTFFSDSTSGTTSAFPEPPGLNYNKGLADYHAKHTWVVNFTWDLPIARQQRGITGALFGGWTLAAINFYRSGTPLTPFIQSNRSRSQWLPSLGPGIGPDRPDFAPGFTHETAVLGGPDQYFNPEAFRLQPAGQLGNAGRGSLIGPDLYTLDLSLGKRFPLAFLGETGSIDLRGEAFNLLNRTNFGVPSLIAFAGTSNSDPVLSSFGRIRSTITSARQIQLSLRIAF